MLEQKPEEQIDFQEALDCLESSEQRHQYMTVKEFIQMLCEDKEQR